MPEVVLTLPKFKAKQQLIFDSKATEILIAGDTRAGKSFFIRKTYIYFCSQIPGLQCDILRLNYDDVINNYMDGETSFPLMLRDWERAGLVKINESEIRFWNDSHILLGHCADDKVARKHQGNAKHMRTVDESAQIPEARLRGLTGWITMSKDMVDRVPEKWRDTFPRMYHLTNFMGPGMGYYRRGFLECREPFVIEQVGQFKRQFIPMYLTDNDSEDMQKTIARIKEAYPDPATQKALLECDWRAKAGDFFPEWNEDRHVVADLKPPPHWFRFRGLDLGYAEPCCVYWVAVSDGEPFKDDNGQERWFPRGAFILYQEWYIADQTDPSKGLRLRNEDIRDGIIARTEIGHRNDITLTDSLPFQDRGGESVPSVFSNRGDGFQLTLGDTSRVVGWNHLRSRLIGKIEGYGEDGKSIILPMIYFCECCEAARRYLPLLQRHKSESKGEDAVEHGEATHSPDTIRIICMAHTVIKDRIIPTDVMVKRELAARKPTVKNLMKQAGHAYFK